MTQKLVKQEVLTTAIFFTNDENDVLKVYNTVTEVKKKMKSFNATVETKEGQAAIRTFAATIASSKAAVERLGLDCNKNLNKQVKATTKIRQEVVASLQKMQDEVRKPLTDIENTEKARVKALSDGVNTIRDSGDWHAQNWENMSIVEAKSQIEELTSMDDGTWQEFNDSAVKNIKDSVEQIKEAIKKREKYDAQQSEIEELRKEKAKREQEERDEQIRKNAVETERKRVELDKSLEAALKDKKSIRESYKIEEDKHTVQENMQHYGGGFVQALGVALSRADKYNTSRIKGAFPDYWNEFLNFK